jgi:hypothetical protein
MFLHRATEMRVLQRAETFAVATPAYPEYGLVGADIDHAQGTQLPDRLQAGAAADPGIVDPFANGEVGHRRLPGGDSVGKDGSPVGEWGCSRALSGVGATALTRCASPPAAGAALNRWSQPTLEVDGGQVTPQGVHALHSKACPNRDASEWILGNVAGDAGLL